MSKTFERAAPATSPQAVAALSRIRQVYANVAPRYDRAMRLWERLCFGASRKWLAQQARGRVLEIGVGTGANLPYYSREIQLTAIDLSPEMLELARCRARDLGRDADLRVGDAQALEFPDASFDTIVSTLSLCTIPDDRRAVAEASRVLRPGGRLLLLEHARSPNPVARIFQRMLNFFTVRFQADHQLREPLDQVRAEGLVVERLDRFRGGWVERLVARKPG